MRTTDFLRMILVFFLGSSCCSCILCLRERNTRSDIPYSHCEGCGRVLTVMELIPVLGYFLCHGQCYFCGYRIPVIYPLTEGICGFAAVLIYLLLVYR
ncbi:MAG: prepilin peptidase [Solobacterium sp.]|nr:prepilin peptidase [Solobacterium sp.]